MSYMGIKIKYLILMELEYNTSKKTRSFQPMSYQKLSEDEVFSLYKTVTRSLSVPLCVYDKSQSNNDGNKCF